MKSEKGEIQMLTEKLVKKSPISLEIDDFPIDFTWCYNDERCIPKNLSNYKLLLKNNFKFDPELHGFNSKYHSNSDPNKAGI